MRTIRPTRLSHSVLLGALLGALPGMTLAQAARAPGKAGAALVMLHRYSFNEAAGSTKVTDAIGGQHGTLLGTGGQFANGQLALPGGEASANGGYVELPSGLVSQLPEAATFEAWVTWKGGRAYQRVFDFGANSNGRGQSGEGTTYLFLTPRSGRQPVVNAAYTLDSWPNEAPVLTGSGPLPEGKQAHVVLVYDARGGTARLYVDGKLADTKPVTEPLSKLKDENNWLGRSNWLWDVRLSGSFNEFRIYQGAMTDADIAASFQRGPDAK